MLVRGPMMRRGPGLIGTMARTAVVAGTATAVVGGVQRRQSARAEQAAEAQQYQGMVEQQPIQTAAAPPATGGGITDDTLERLERLAALHTSGVLTDREFEDQKAKILT